MKSLAAGAAIAALFQAIGHFQPWAQPWNRPSVPRRIFAYVWGVTGILLGLAVATDLEITKRALGVSAAAGAATVGVYVVDELLNGNHS